MALLSLSPLAAFADAPPAPAAAADYNLRTFGPSLTIGLNWHRFNFNGVNPNAVHVKQNGDGSVTISGGGNTYNAQLSTARRTSTGKLWDGIAFGNGGYFEATLSWSGNYNAAGGWPAWWSNDIESLSGSKTAQWPGQRARYSNWIEPDFMEYWANRSYGGALHNWYGQVGSGDQVQTTFPEFKLPDGADAARPHKYGFLWVPATPKQRGRAEFYFDRSKIGAWDVSWNQHAAELGPPPSHGTTAYSVLDVRHIALILGSGPHNPMTVYSVEVWQKSVSGNIPTSSTP